MPRYKLTLEYDGTGLAGWQKVPDRASVQSLLETAVLGFCGSAMEVVGAGRTDAGVHARAAVAHVDLPKDYSGFTVMQALNFHLLNEEKQRQVSVVHAERVADDFHARFHAVNRHYFYSILNRRAPSALDARYTWHVPEKLDAKKMQQAANHLLGHHDFTSFRDSECQAKSPEKTLDTLSVDRHGDDIHIRAAARSFLHHQMRIMVGTLVEVGRGKWDADAVKTALESRDRRAAGPTAPPHGLYLMGVEYQTPQAESA